MASHPSRREFLEQMAAVGIGLSHPIAAETRAAQARTRSSPTFLDLLRSPDAVIAETIEGNRSLSSSGGDWRGDGVAVTTQHVASVLRIRLSAPGTAVKRLHLRWRGRTDATTLVLGDAWERGYGDLEWRGIVPDRVMPWYFAAYDGQLTHAYGVRTGPRAFCLLASRRRGNQLVRRCPQWRGRGATWGTHPRRVRGPEPRGTSR